MPPPRISPSVAWRNSGTNASGKSDSSHAIAAANSAELALEIACVVRAARSSANASLKE